MTAAEQVSEMYNAIQAELVGVRAQYSRLAEATRLMRRQGAQSVEEAFIREATARVKRNLWATVTRAA